MLARQLYEGIITENLYGSQVYLEIGSFDGSGIAMLSQQFPHKIFYSIDPFIEDGNTSLATGVGRGNLINQIREEYLQNTKDANNIVHFNMTSEEFIKRELYKTISPDVLFIDGDHSSEGVSIDLSLAALFARNKRIFVVMDDLFNEEVIKALDQFKKDHPEIVFNVLNDYGATYFYI